MTLELESTSGPGVWTVDVQEHEGTVVLRFSFYNGELDCMDSYLMPIDIVPRLCNELIDLWLTHSEPKPIDLEVLFSGWVLDREEGEN